MQALAREAPGLRCELVEAEPEQSLPALALGDLDLVLADEWQHQPRSRPAGVDRHDLHRDPVHLVLAEDHPAARRPRATRCRWRELAGEPWATGHPGTGWEEMTERTCRQLGGFDPDVRHRANDSVVCVRLVAHGLAVTLLPDLAPRGPPRRRARATSPKARCTGPSTPQPARRTPATLRPGSARRRARRGHRTGLGRRLGRWLIPSSRARGGTPDQAGRRTVPKQVAALPARRWVTIQRRSGGSSVGARTRNQPSTTGNGPPAPPPPGPARLGARAPRAPGARPRGRPAA